MITTVANVLIAAAAVVLAAGCAATPVGPTSFLDDPEDREPSLVAPCAVTAKLRASRGTTNPHRVLWNARLTCVGGPGNNQGGDPVRVRFGGELIVNGRTRARKEYRVVFPIILESGQAIWICGEDGRNPPWAECMFGLRPTSTTWSIKASWTWCRVSLGDCPADPFDEPAATATITVSEG
ncbi:MAG: hypothetical protein OXH75_21275 [Acidobacteria bacterium]|nr:hypothetical protein [Acidobacteriota bacterium]